MFAPWRLRCEKVVHARDVGWMCVCVCGRLFELSIGEKADQFGLARLSAGA